MKIITLLAFVSLSPCQVYKWGMEKITINHNWDDFDIFLVNEQRMREFTPEELMIGQFLRVNNDTIFIKTKEIESWLPDIPVEIIMREYKSNN